MTRAVFGNANRAGTTLAAALSVSGTSATLVSTPNFPAPVSDQFFPLVLSSVTTPANFEVSYVTAVSGNVVTLERGQEGTTPLAFNAGDIASIEPTAGIMNLFGQLAATLNLWTGENVFPAGSIFNGKNIQAFTTVGSSSFTVPSNVTAIYGRVWGGGGGGGGTASTNGAAVGGGGGGYTEGLITGLTPGQVITITVGPGGGGGGGGSGPGAGATAGTSSIGTFMTASGGTGGEAATTAPVNNTANGGIGAGGALIVSGGESWAPFLGGAGGGVVTSAGGASFGSAMAHQGATAAAANGIPGHFPGGGAGGGANGGNGGAGAGGAVVLIW